jgi:MoxR-like ATPase
MAPIEPVVLAALITAEPLLLIGPHGTGKSFLLNRISAALGLVCRHYNASLLNFDDLVGYPLPNGHGQLEYVRTPSAIWGAQTVFLDEISRCRPDMQNKLFPIIHEKRVQGIELEELVYRWSAMNPPRSEEDLEAAYVGSEPLDAALADRFAFVVDVPAWNDFSEEEQARVIQSRDVQAKLARDPEFSETVERGRRLYVEQREELESCLVGYVRFLVSLLGRAGIVLSPRRAGMLLRNILAVHTGNCLLRTGVPLKDSALLAVMHSLPQKAQGIRVDQVKLLAAHREAWNATQIPELDPSRAVFNEPDPLRRVMKASLAPSLSQEAFSSIVADALAALPPGGRHALAFRLFESASVERFVAAIAEQCAELYTLVTVAQGVHESVPGMSSRRRTWQRIVEVLARLEPEREDTTLKTNLLCGLFSAGQLAVATDVEQALAEWDRVIGSVCFPRSGAREEAA